MLESIITKDAHSPRTAVPTRGELEGPCMSGEKCTKTGGIVTIQTDED